MSSSIDLSSLKEGGKMPEALKMQLMTNAIGKFFGSYEGNEVAGFFVFSQ